MLAGELVDAKEKLESVWGISSLQNIVGFADSCQVCSFQSCAVADTSRVLLLQFAPY